MSTSNNNFSFFPAFSPQGFLEKKSPRGFFKTSVSGSKIKLRFTLAICMTHVSMFQVYINILIFPMGKNPRGDISPQEFFPAGIFPHGDFFSAQYSSLEDLIQWQSIFSAFIHIYIVYGMDPAQLLHVVVKQACKLYF